MRSTDEAGRSSYVRSYWDLQYIGVVEGVEFLIFEPILLLSSHLHMPEDEYWSRG